MRLPLAGILAVLAASASANPPGVPLEQCDNLEAFGKDAGRTLESDGKTWHFWFKDSSQILCLAGAAYIDVGTLRYLHDKAIAVDGDEVVLSPQDGAPGQRFRLRRQDLVLTALTSSDKASPPVPRKVQKAAWLAEERTTAGLTAMVKVRVEKDAGARVRQALGKTAAGSPLFGGAENEVNRILLTSFVERAADREEDLNAKKKTKAAGLPWVDIWYTWPLGKTKGQVVVTYHRADSSAEHLRWIVPPQGPGHLEGAPRPPR
jgi:hypothetical protein